MAGFEQRVDDGVAFEVVACEPFAEKIEDDKELRFRGVAALPVLIANDGVGGQAVGWGRKYLLRELSRPGLSPVLVTFGFAGMEYGVHVDRAKCGFCFRMCRKRGPQRCLG